jgi:hypothetical protein
LVSRLDAPGPNPLRFAVGAASGSVPGVGTIDVYWTPSAADFRAPHGTCLQGSLFAQAIILACPPNYPADYSAVNNWSPYYWLCAQHMTTVTT